MASKISFFAIEAIFLKKVTYLIGFEFLRTNILVILFYQIFNVLTIAKSLDLIKVPTTTFILKSKNGKKNSVSIVKKMLKLMFFLCWKKNCKQYLDSYCSGSTGLIYLQFLCVWTTQKALKYVQRCLLLCFAVAMHPSYNKCFDQNQLNLYIFHKGGPLKTPLFFTSKFCFGIFSQNFSTVLWLNNVKFYPKNFKYLP